jgi:hypothetical protein
MNETFLSDESETVENLDGRISEIKITKEGDL